MAAVHGVRSNFLSGEYGETPPRKYARICPGRNHLVTISHGDSHPVIAVKIVTAEAAVPFTALMSDSWDTSRGSLFQSRVLVTVPTVVDIRQRHPRVPVLQMTGDARLRVQRIAGFLEARLVEAEHGVPFLRKIVASRDTRGFRPAAGQNRQHVTRHRADGGHWPATADAGFPVPGGGSARTRDPRGH